jgi:hypothetical protein
MPQPVSIHDSPSFSNQKRQKNSGCSIFAAMLRIATTAEKCILSSTTKLYRIKALKITRRHSATLCSIVTESGVVPITRAVRDLC